MPIWARYWSRTNRRRADDRLPWARSLSMADTISDKVRSRPDAISFSPFQNASSRLTLVLWPAITIERLTTGDFITPSVFRVNVGRTQGGFVELPRAARDFLQRLCATMEAACNHGS